VRGGSLLARVADGKGHETFLAGPGMERTCCGNKSREVARCSGATNRGTWVAEQALLMRSTRLDPVPRSAGEARELIRATLAAVGEDDVVPSAELAVSELVTNAILHAATAVEVSVRVTAQEVTVSVRDWHSRLPLQRAASLTATTGRGLALVASVTDEFGVDPEQPTGKSVWFRLVRGKTDRVG
jgi:anti-sigma regulatory factor (Ser/Thr protein kinase)